MGKPAYKNGFNLTLHPEKLDDPMRWKKGRMVFVNSMSDMFHEKIPDDFIHAVWITMWTCDRHKFQILTKRPERMMKFCCEHANPALKNVWLGTSCEDQPNHDNRVLHLLRTPAAVRFLSLEPLLGPIDVNLKGIDWVIVGGESGPGARPMNPDWARAIRDQCVSAGVPFFMKQICNERGRKVPFDQWPDDLKIREFPDGHLPIANQLSN